MLFTQAPDWDVLDVLLSRHIRPCVRARIQFNAVDYGALAADPGFSRLLHDIAQTDSASLTQQERLAFYINVYNLFAMKMVIDHSPIHSIRDAGSLFTPVWKKPVATLGGESVTLDHIEHGILRTMGEPRIHFAIVCASMSCPDIRTEAYRAERLDAQLDDQTARFLRDPTKGLLLKGKQGRMSPIFAWFEEDFAPSGGVEAFIRRYRELPSQVGLKASLPYCWDLNSQDISA